MKILIVIGGFLPGRKYGGPPISVDNFCKLMNEDDCYVVTVNHDMDDDQPYTNINKGWNARANYNVLYLKDEEYEYKHFEKIVDEIRPDIIYLQGLFQSCIMPCLQIAKKKNIKVLLAPRGELCVGAFKKKYKKVPYILALKLLGLLKNVSFQSTSDEETERIHKLLDIPFERIFSLSNIPTIPKEQYKFSEKKRGQARFIFLSRIHPKKNLLAAIKFFKEINGDVIFDIYGSLEDEDYWKKCQQEIKLLPSNVKVKYCGLVSHEDVHEIFSRYDAFIFPTFSENYGHVIVEALVSGCPVIISDQTPWNDVEPNGAGWVCGLENEDGFISAIKNVIDVHGNEHKRNAQRYAKKKLQLDELRKEYKQALKIIMRR